MSIVKVPIGDLIDGMDKEGLNVLIVITSLLQMKLYTVSAVVVSTVLIAHSHVTIAINPPVIQINMSVILVAPRKSLIKSVIRVSA